MVDADWFYRILVGSLELPRPLDQGILKSVVRQDPTRQTRRRASTDPSNGVSEGREPGKENLMRGYVSHKGGRWYAVIYEGLNQVIGKEPRRWEHVRRRCRSSNALLPHCTIVIDVRLNRWAESERHTGPRDPPFTGQSALDGKPGLVV
jgi:hypothetical protein